MTEKRGACLGYEFVKEGEERILRFDCEDCPFFPSLEDNETVMAAVIDALAENPSATRIVLSQKRDYEYDFDQTQMLLEVASLQKQLSRQRLFMLDNANPSLYMQLKNLFHHQLKADPAAAYYVLRGIYDTEKAKKGVASARIAAFLGRLVRLLESTKLISTARNFSYTYGSRSIYRHLLRAAMRPDFMFTRLMSAYPADAEEIDTYSVNGTEISIFRLPNAVQKLYHILPPEFKLSEDKYELLDQARNIISEHKPQRSEFVDPERMRSVFFNVGNDMIDELAESRGLKLRSREVEMLAEILVRYTIGFGLIEVLLQDEKIQDITINSPLGRLPAFIVHQDHNECTTNIIPTSNEGDSWATKLRLISGRPLDEANPILDTELLLPNARARVAAISSPLNPSGIAFAFRRHRDKPWTLPLFIKGKMISPLSAGLISFLVDGSRTILVAGTRSAGKTSLLGSLMTEVMRKNRLITIEDSVSGDSELLVRRNGMFERTTISMLVERLVQKHGSWHNLTDHEVTGNPEGIEVFAMDKDGKIRMSRASKFIRHKAQKPLFSVTTRTGRIIKVTGDHSLFTIGENGEIVEAKVRDLGKGSHIAVPRRLPWSNKVLYTLPVFEKLERMENCYVSGEAVEEMMKSYRRIIISLCKERGVPKGTRNFWMRQNIMPANILSDLRSLGHSILGRNLKFKIGKNSIKWLPANIALDDTFLTFVGMWLADGCYDKNSVIVSAVDEEDREVVKRIAARFSLPVKMHSDGFSLMLKSKTLKAVLMDAFELKGDAYTKRIPEWVYNLSENQIACVLKGIFSSDGCVAEKEIVIPLASLNLLKDIQFLLSIFGILLRIGTIRKDGTYNAGISSLSSWKLFKEHIGILQGYKKQKLGQLCAKRSTHTTSDVVPLTISSKHELAGVVKNFNRNDYIRRNNRIGRAKLGSMLETVSLQSKLMNNLRSLTCSDIFWDEVRELVQLANEEWVYDISVPECESFICGNIIAHNTLELPVEDLKKLQYNIQSLKVASSLTQGTDEASADEGIRSTLRLGDSGLIVGEVRSTEARALYEAMRVGALANVVAGTIHGDSPYGVFDRVVNDLGVPRTSFKATDIIIVANPLRSPDGLHRYRRVFQITEVGKFWQQDPVAENGFIDLMRYNPNSDTLEPTSELQNGDSDVLKSIAGNVKEWAGSWDAVWDNITLRARIKEAIVKSSDKLNRPDILEADFVVGSNDEFHRVSDNIRSETGGLDSKRIFFEWNEWLKKRLKGKQEVNKKNE